MLQYDTTIQGFRLSILNISNVQPFLKASKDNKTCMCRNRFKIHIDYVQGYIFLFCLSTES